MPYLAARNSLCRCGKGPRFQHQPQTHPPFVEFCPDALWVPWRKEKKIHTKQKPSREMCYVKNLSFCSVFEAAEWGKEWKQAFLQDLDLLCLAYPTNFPLRVLVFALPSFLKSLGGLASSIQSLARSPPFLRCAFFLFQIIPVHPCVQVPRKVCVDLENEWLQLSVSLGSFSVQGCLIWSGLKNISIDLEFTEVMNSCCFLTIYLKIASSRLHGEDQWGNQIS